MLIRVIYADGKFDMVNGLMLDRYLAERNIIKFQRHNGWVDVRTDRLRGHVRSNEHYSGPERRLCNENENQIIM